MDVGLAPLIATLYHAGLHTRFSCQEHQPGVAWIQFDDATDVEAFIGAAASIARERGDEDILIRINGERRAGRRPNDSNWWVTADIGDAAFSNARPDGGWPIHDSLHIPTTDIAFAEEVAAKLASTV